MKVLYDHQVFSLQDFGGVSLIFSELLRIYKQMPDQISAKAFAPFTGNINLQVVQNQLSWHLLHNIGNPLRFKVQFKLNEFLSRFAVSQGNFDVFHPTYFNPSFLPYLHKPLIVTVHDMAHEVFSNDPAFNADVRKNKQLLVEKADKVIVISQFTKGEMLKYYKVPEEKIEIVYLGGDQILRPEVQDAGNFAAILPKKYIVYDGARKASYKNFIPFLTAIAPILNRVKDLYVVCAGGVPFSQEEQAIFTSLNIEKQLVNIPLRGSMPMQAVFWKNATLFAYPSLYEGFGIPFVQSMLCGCPVVGHNQGSTPEVGQDAIFYFDGRNQESIRATVEEALFNVEKRKEKIALGLKRGQDFSWKKTAENTLHIYESVL